MDDLDIVVDDFDAPPVAAAASTPQITSTKISSSTTASTNVSESNSHSKLPVGLLDAILRQHLLKKGIHHDPVFAQGLDCVFRTGIRLGNCVFVWWFEQVLHCGGI